MAAAVVARSVLRSATVRASASRISGSIKPTTSCSPFSIRTQSHRIFRSPVVEMSSFAMESLLPFHTATASALMTSMLSSTAPSRCCAWLIDDS